MICGCCGQVVRADAALAGVARAMAPMRRRILEVMIAASAPVPGERLVAAVYGSDPQGGPETALASVRSTICHMRRDLRRIGWSIVPKSRGAGYVLVPLPLDVVILQGASDAA